MGKIGFKNYDNEDKAPKKEPKPSSMNTQKELFRNFITQKYNNEGEDSDKNFRTSRELQFECRDMCEPSLPDVAVVMTELKFRAELSGGHFAWVVYDKEPIRY